MSIAWWHRFSAPTGPAIRGDRDAVSRAAAAAAAKYRLRLIQLCEFRPTQADDEFSTEMEQPWRMNSQPLLAGSQQALQVVEQLPEPEAS